jgi:glycosyltransferase involved in cell wall biosynthesis
MVSMAQELTQIFHNVGTFSHLYLRYCTHRTNHKSDLARISGIKSPFLKGIYSGVSKVSLVIPTFNGMRTIENALRSTLLEVEIGEIIICVNGDSGYFDFCERLALKYGDPRVRVVLNGNQPSPMAENWTFASNLASSEYLRILCDDDEVIEGSTFNLVRILEQSKGYSFVSGKRRVVSEDGTTLIESLGFGSRERAFNVMQTLRRCSLIGTTIFGEPSAMLFRRIDLIECLPWSSEHKYAVDLDMCLRILKHKASYGVVTDQIVSTFQVHSSSLSSNLSRIQSQDFTSLIKEHRELLGSYPLTWVVMAKIQSYLRMYARKLFYLRLKSRELDRLR